MGNRFAGDCISHHNGAVGMWGGGGAAAVFALGHIALLAFVVTGICPVSRPCLGGLCVCVPMIMASCIEEGVFFFTVLCEFYMHTIHTHDLHPRARESLCLVRDSNVSRARDYKAV